MRLQAHYDQMLISMAQLIPCVRLALGNKDKTEYNIYFWANI